MNAFDQARRYLDKIDPAISGQGGHDATFHAACVLTNGFGLSESEAWPLLCEYNDRCQPRWSERELRHKLADALRKTHDKPNGHMLSKRKGHVFMNRQPVTLAPLPAPKKETPKARYDLDPDAVLPPPILDGTAELIRVAFEPGEYLRITLGEFNDEGKEQPNRLQSKASFDREYWLKKLESKKGDINRTLNTTARNGIYIGVNPMEKGGEHDKDVTAFRHVLVEWDRDITRAQQFDLLIKSNLPLAAVIDSGGKSVHGWVIVNAKDKADYDDRVEFIYSHFAASGFPLDKKNRNPSRYSRLPGCMRFDSRQELLSLRVGAESFDVWRRGLEADDLGPCHRIVELSDVDTKSDPNCVIGFKDGRTLRYLCREKSAWIIGPSGIGKSTLTTEFAIGWALGLPVYGITPARPLRSLIIQAENDFFDLAEMVQGVIKAHDLEPAFDADGRVELVNKNVLFKTEDTCVGAKFIDRLHRLIERERPDVVWVDPLLSFAGIDVLKQDQVSQFLREGINPVLKATGAVMIGIHHTGKLRNSKKEMENWSALDFAYAGLGSSELVNWARAVMTLVPIEDGLYRLELAKRGSRAGATHPDGTDARSSLFLKHTSKGGIRWEQVEVPSAPEPDNYKKGGAPDKVSEVAASNLHPILSSLPPEGESAKSLGKRLVNWARSKGKSIGETTARTRLLDKLIENGKLTYDMKSELYRKGPNA